MRRFLSQHFLSVLSATALILLPGPTLAADSEAVDYLTQVKPLLEAKCYSCHGVLKQEGGLRLETLALMVTGGDSGEAVIAGDTDGSMLLERVAAEEDYRMPPADEGAALKTEEIDLLRRWIQQGAQAPEEETPSSPTEHWSFRTVERPDMDPSAIETGTNPIDWFLQQKHNRQQLQTAPVAARSLLLRRLYLDLTGLPPSREQLQDTRPWNDIVDELLASPHHGERWGRHWMDIWRYTDWYGLGAQLRYSQKHMWRWRDWIVESLNADKGYDRMIQEMLAGDELDPDNPEVVAGTGFLARNYYLFNRTTWLDSTIEHTSKAFLGLTMNCAKCHDHKYDPLTQADYYSLRAIFEPHQIRLDPVPGETNFEKDGLPRAFDDQPDIPTYLHVRGDPKNPDKDTEIVPGVPALLASFQPEIVPVPLPPTAYAPGIRDYVQQDHLRQAQAAVSAAERKLAKARKTQAELPPPAEQTSAATDFQFVDDFQAERPDDWQITGDGWRYADGNLQQTQVSRDTSFLILKHQLPRDFELTCRYVTNGGGTWNSVSFRFDQIPEQKFANFVYTSAHAGDPKVQVAFERSGQMTYPGEGRVSRPVMIDDEIELRFAVRDRLVNVWYNGELAVAYELPSRQPHGRCSLSGFDTAVTFRELSIRSLPQDTRLTEASNATSPSDAAAAVTTAEAQLTARRANLAAVTAVLAADRSRHTDSTSEDTQQLARVAAERTVAAELAAAEYERLAAGEDKKKLKAATGRADKARKMQAEIDRGKFDYPELRASRKALESPAHKEPDYPATYASTSTGRRLALARWMTDRQQPLTARVAVNHVWTRHFGEPLVASMFDFGLRTEEPLHRDLLDWLAAEFMESGWSFKHLHRLMVTSQAYQRTSSAAGTTDSTRTIDPTNRYYWRMNARRMESQVVRDTLLQLAGTLDRTLGGPSLDVNSDSRRRSLYFKHSRDDQDKFLTMFDDADLLNCYRRAESIVPQQALALANSRLSLSLAGSIADNILQSLPSQASSFPAVAFESLLGRPAEDTEQQAMLDYLQQLDQLLLPDVPDEAARQARCRARLIHSLLNHNDFISIR